MTGNYHPIISNAPTQQADTSTKQQSQESTQPHDQQLEILMDTSPPTTSTISYPVKTNPAEPAGARYAGLLYHNAPPTALYKNLLQILSGVSILPHSLSDFTPFYRVWQYTLAIPHHRIQYFKYNNIIVQNKIS
jgi:hypothetical protein